MSKKPLARTTTAGTGRTKFTHVGLLLQLVPWAYVGCGALVGCASGVTRDDTQATSETNPDAGQPNETITSRDASVEETTTEGEQSSTTRPSTTSTTRSTTTQTTVSPTSTTTTTAPESSEANTSDDETTDSSSTDDTTSDTTAVTDTDDAGSSDESTSDTTDPIPGGQGIFIALGHGQRSTVSCDDGQTWTHNRFTDDIPLSGTDTDHIPFSMRAASYDAGAFYVAWGWGSPSYVERSTDGVNWTGVFGSSEPDRTGNDWVWGLVAGDGKIAMGENRRFFFSDDNGMNWENTNPGVASQKAIFGYGGGAFVVAAEGGDQGDAQFLRSTDGLAWSNDVDVPDECFGGRVTSIPYANGTFLFAAGSHFCSSTDGGQSWQYRAVPSGQVRSALHDGTRFIAMTDNGNLFASTDALEWEQIGQLQGSGGGMAFGASKTTGTLVGVRGGVFYRSDNGGASFEELPESAYTPTGGPIVQIEFGAVASSEACP